MAAFMSLFVPCLIYLACFLAMRGLFRFMRRAMDGAGRSRSLARAATPHVAPPAGAARFREEVRAAVVSTARQHPRLADLAASCPAALVAIAAPGNSAEDRDASDRARALVIDGRSVAEVLTALGAPLWLRRARPETFKARPPRLPDSPALRRAIGSFVPTDASAIDTAAKDPSRWLDVVVCAFETADEEVATWAARCAARSPELIWDHDLRLVLLWAWFARRSGDWSPRIGWTLARQQAGRWRTQTEFDIFGGPAEWALADGEFEGFVFVPLTTQEAIEDEGAAMDHCVASYARDVALGDCALWGMRRGDERVATLEVGGSCGADFMTVRQLYGFGNAPAPHEAWRAATLFSLARAEAALAEAAPRVDENDVRRGWEALFEPYWAEKGGVTTWAPMRPQGRALCL